MAACAGTLLGRRGLGECDVRALQLLLEAAQPASAVVVQASSSEAAAAAAGGSGAGAAIGHGGVQVVVRAVAAVTLPLSFGRPVAAITVVLTAAVAHQRNPRLRGRGTGKGAGQRCGERQPESPRPCRRHLLCRGRRWRCCRALGGRPGGCQIPGSSRALMRRHGRWARAGSRDALLQR